MFLTEIYKFFGEYSFAAGMETLFAVIMILLAISVRREQKEVPVVANWHLYAMILSQLISLVAEIPLRALMTASGGFSVGVKILCGISYVTSIGVVLFFTYYLVAMLRTRVFISENVYYSFAFIAGLACIVWIAGLARVARWLYIPINGGGYEPTILCHICRLVPGLFLFFDFVMILSCRKALERTELWSWIFFEAAPLIGQILYWFLGGSASSLATAAGIIVLYINIHTERTTRMAVAESELADSKKKLMISQIQPHFMYNTLNTIYYLIGKDPKQAKDAVSIFSDYLRANINSLKSEAPVSFTQELAHLNAYLYLEKLRFDDELNIVQNIGASDFKIPSLSIQPLMENAVKHGLGPRPGGGTVSITTEETKTSYRVTVADDGVGFDPASVNSDGGVHVGIANVRSRIEIMCHGTLTITSAPGEGTTAVIDLPKEGQPKDQPAAQK